MTMQKIRVACPCCGHPLVLSITADDMDAQALEQDEAAQIASGLGFELGAVKGGEKIGD